MDIPVTILGLIIVSALAYLCFNTFFKSEKQPISTVTQDKPNNDFVRVVTNPKPLSANDRHIAKIYTSKPHMVSEPEPNNTLSYSENQDSSSSNALDTASVVADSPKSNIKPRPKRRKIIESTDTSPPKSMEEAKIRDHHHTKLPRYALHYCATSGKASWRIISRITDNDETFSADCHYRNGARRLFKKEGIVELIDLSTGEVLHLSAPN